MNQRIRELALQAQPDPVAYRVEHFQGSVGYWDKNEPVWKSGLYQESKEHFTCKPLYTQEDLKKFAELIVRKCARMADCERNRDPGKFILEHFGVEP